MAGLVLGIHVLWRHKRKGMDGRDKPGHDKLWGRADVLAATPRKTWMAGINPAMTVPVEASPVRDQGVMR